jgi:hypothetical protein
MRWTFLIIAACACAVLWGVGPEFALYAAFLVLLVNFATVCIQYDEPLRRAQARVADQLSRLKPGGEHADLYQRLQSATPEPTAAERHVGYGPLTLLNIATGLAATGLLVWALVLRAT